MKLIGEIEIFGKVHLATVELENNKIKGVTFVGGNVQKYKAYGYEGGKIMFYGYYNTKAEAERAAKEKRNLARESRERHGRGTVRRDAGTGISFVSGSRTWRVQLNISGKRVSLSRYATYGHAVLVRDVVARRTGKTAIVKDYEMPLGLVNDPVARSFITDIVRSPTKDEIAEYERRVVDLNASVNRAVQQRFDS